VREHYNAVRKSSLYEYAGISKPLLMLIAGLIIAPPEEGQKADPELPPGWCIASQDTLAAMVGCSVEEVNRQVAKFERDGWLNIKRFRDDRGCPRCHYEITPKQLKKIQAREMQKDADGHYIRAKCPLSARKRESQKVSQKNLIWNKESQQPLDEPSKSLLTNHQEANCESIKKPLDDSSMKLLQSVVPSLDVSSGRFPEKTEEPQPLGTKEGTKNQSQPQEPTGTTSLSGQTKPVKGSAPNRRAPVRNYLKAGPAAALRNAGCPDEAIAEITKLEFWSRALNDTSNPITAYVTLCMKENGPAKRLSHLWMPKLKEHGVITHADADFDSGLTEADKNALMAERAEMTDEQREMERAWYWWAGLTTEQQGSYSVTYTWDKDGFGWPNEKEVLAAYRAVREAKAKSAVAVGG
jgi:hypothetical protein